MKKLLIVLCLVGSLFAGEVENALNMINHGQQEEGITKLEALVKNGNEQAKLELGGVYISFYAINPNIPKQVLQRGMTLVEDMAKSGNGKAQLFLGNGYMLLGNGQEALKWYKKAAAQKLPNALTHIGELYDRGLLGKRDINKAIYWYKKAAKLNNFNSCVSLGLIYYYNKKDYKKALKYFQKAYDLGERFTAAYYLGSLYKDGLGVKQDYKKVAKYIQESAEQGNAGAQTDLGVLYATGQGVKMDKIKAYQWWFKAAQQGSVQAQNNLDKLCKESPWACKQ